MIIVEVWSCDAASADIVVESGQAETRNRYCQGSNTNRSAKSKVIALANLSINLFLP
jgi:hypothetical protein